MSEVNEEKRLALSTLCKICEDDSAPATARASAARTLLEVCGEIGRLQTERPNENKGLHETDCPEGRLPPPGRGRTRVEFSARRSHKIFFVVAFGLHPYLVLYDLVDGLLAQAEPPCAVGLPESFGGNNLPDKIGYLFGKFSSACVSCLSLCCRPDAIFW